MYFAGAVQALRLGVGARPLKTMRKVVVHADLRRMIGVAQPAEVQ
jgi:hypothetical protein